MFFFFFFFFLGGGGGGGGEGRFCLIFCLLSTILAYLRLV